MEARGIHRVRACASLYTYCLYELRMSEDTAFRRARAAKWVREFPVLLDAIATGELHLTGLLLLAPHLTEANHREVLARAKHRTKREIMRLVRMLDPLPDVPSCVEPLGPALPAAPRNPSWEEAMLGLCPVRELLPGDRPKDWVSPDGASLASDAALLDKPANDQSSMPEHAPVDVPAPERDPLIQQRYKVQFTATNEYVDLLEQAKALLSHAISNGSLEAIHLRALRSLVRELKKTKYAVTESAGEGGEVASGVVLRLAVSSKERTLVAAKRSKKSDPRRQRARTSTPASERGTSVTAPRQRGRSSTSPPERGTTVANQDPSGQIAIENTQERPEQKPRNRPRTARSRSRYIPAAVRRAVFHRDGFRCTYVDAQGRRCRETHYLELHHLDPHALGGPPSAENLTLRCRAHNALAAEQDFGRDFMSSILATPESADRLQAPRRRAGAGVRQKARGSP